MVACIMVNLQKIASVGTVSFHVVVQLPRMLNMFKLQALANSFFFVRRRYRIYPEKAFDKII